MVQTIRKELFKNDTDADFVWFNDMQKTLLVALFDKHGILIYEYQIYFMDYVVVPSGGIIYFVKDL